MPPEAYVKEWHNDGTKKRPALFEVKVLLRDLIKPPLETYTPGGATLYGESVVRFFKSLEGAKHFYFTKERSRLSTEQPPTKPTLQ